MNLKLNLIRLFSIIGMLDAGYLTYEHYAGIIPPCAPGLPFADCGTVLQSSYAVVFGLPIAAFGVLFYITVLFLTLLITKKNQRFFQLLFTVTSIGFITSAFLIYLQIFVLQAICLYCMLSAISSIAIFITAVLLSRDLKKP